MNTAAFLDWIARSLVLGALLAMADRSLRIGGDRQGEAFPAFALLTLAALTALCGSGIGFVVLPGPALAASAPGMEIPGWLPILWTTGAVFFLGREILGTVFLVRQVRRAKPIGDPAWRERLERCGRNLGIDYSRIELRRSGHLGPAAVGIFRPIILLPPDARRWSDFECDAILAHELTHLTRRDLLRRAFARLVCIVQWFNPFAWMFARQLELESEIASDATAARLTLEPRGYARMLLRLCEATHRRAPAMLPAFGQTGSILAARIRRLLDPASRRPAWILRLGLSAAIALCILASALAACRWIAPPSPETKWTRHEIELRLSANPFPGDG